MTAQPTVTPRHPGDAEPNLTDYVVVHRAMTVDLHRLAAAADEIAQRAAAVGPRRAAALRDYLAGVDSEIRSHHHVEDEVVWPLLVALAGPEVGLTGLTDDHHRLDPLLDAADELADRLAADPADHTVAVRLAATLGELSELLDRHVADEERDVFPLIRRLVRVEDYARLQRRFRDNLSVRALPFVVPWAVRHATAEERPRILADAGWPLRMLLAIFQGRFTARERLAFG